MSQPPSTSQAPNFHLQVLFQQQRLELLKLRDALPEVTGEENTLEWVERYRTAVVRGGLFLFGMFLTFSDSAPLWL